MAGVNSCGPTTKYPVWIFFGRCSSLSSAMKELFIYSQLQSVTMTTQKPYNSMVIVVVCLSALWREGRGGDSVHQPSFVVMVSEPSQTVGLLVYFLSAL